MLVALNPNSGAIYGREKTPDFTALVMELVEGEDLSQRIARGSIRLDEALPIAKQIADALEPAQGAMSTDTCQSIAGAPARGECQVVDLRSSVCTFLIRRDMFRTSSVIMSFF